MADKLLSLDVDNTVIYGEKMASIFPKVWEKLPSEKKPLLCYNTGRMLDNMIQLIEDHVLAIPDYIISGVGTNIYDYKNRKILKKFSEILEEGWDIETVEKIIEELPFQIDIQPKHFQHAYKRSYYFKNATNEDLEYIKFQFHSKGLAVNIIYSYDVFLDILPKWANKGNALQWLLQKIEMDPENAIVAGDSGNDSAMFDIPGIKGIVVGNAQHELYQVTKHLDVYHASGKFSQGVVEGLVHYEIVPEALKNEEQESSVITEQMVEHLDHEVIEAASKEEIDFILEGYHKAIEAIHHNITPLGFSACSLTHNQSNGTDENYRSVWARDGAITILGTIPLIKDNRIHECQRKTLETLLENVSKNGQIASNIRIDDGVPDYSGVGGICSIDSGLWVIIAFYEYIKATQDIDFLRKYIEPLKKTMFWLAAHDGNNDALLEIPEAGDWTDLFGRSYNVLYDEILWYRANICFGRMLEKLGLYEEAGDYIRWSQVIKREILSNFWPSTQQQLTQLESFTERQFSLGDARYLIAQVTPFDFSWRCDTYGNVLAFLYDVIDEEKAAKTFRFLWGVGANEPYPIRNVYPAVNPGDPDWRPYYTVNLLNLPNHYHNGGIWPFVGGAWVRFIHKLGLKKIAVKELHRLAQLNYCGIQYDWEFNEWAHGTTGRPMGKIYQAWSAAEYILACHKLKLVK